MIAGKGSFDPEARQGDRNPCIIPPFFEGLGSVSGTQRKLKRKKKKSGKTRKN